MSTTERVSLARCASTASDAEIVERTHAAITALPDFGAGLRGARKIAVKINAGVPRVVLTDGKQTELTEPAVIEGAIRAIRNVTDAEIVLGDAPTHGDADSLYAQLRLPERLAPYGNVRLLDFGEGELVQVRTSHDRAMFSEYMLHRELAEADAFVSLAKMKAHTGMGCTLCIKNLFGWTPPSVYGQPRHYLHDRLIRLPRVLADLAAMMRPCLNVVDGIVAANKSEWRGTPMRPGVIVAGTNIVATDYVGARVMGFDPNGDYPSHPFFYRRNAIRLAASLGVGPNDPASIEILGPAPEAVAQPFKVERYGESDRDAELRAGVECVHRYLHDRSSHLRAHAGQYLALLDGEVLWDGPDIHTLMRFEHESGRDWRSVPQLLVRCVPASEEIERFAAYDEEVAALACA